MINDKFIHIHIPRTGGQLLRGVIFKRRKKFKFLVKNSHLTLQESLEILQQNAPGAKVQIFCVVRNPWDWYVSRYFFRQKETAGQKNKNVGVEHQGNSMAGFRRHMEISFSRKA